MAVLTIDAAWSAEIDSAGTKYPNDGVDVAGGDGTLNYRIAIKFDITDLPVGADVTQVDLSLNVESTHNGSGALTTMLWDIGPCNGNGQSDPEADSGATAYSRCNVAGDLYVNDTAAFRTTGLKSFANLGSTANADLEAARAAGTVFSLGIAETTDTTTNARSRLSEYADATAAERPTLTITYTVPAAGAARSQAVIAG